MTRLLLLAAACAGACAPACAEARPNLTAATSPEPTETAPAPSSSATSAPQPKDAQPALVALGPGFPAKGPWLSFYGTAAEMGDLSRAARTYRILNIDADPGAKNFTDAQIQALKNGGKNRVISYLNLGSCERFRTYWSSAPDGFVSCGANEAARRGGYEGYADEVWMDLSDERYQKLILGYVAPRLAARGVDGFYLDNLEMVEHSQTTKNGRCSAACRQGGLDLVRKLREAFPDKLLVMQNATSDVTRTGTTGGIAFPTLLDGIAHEEVFEPKRDAEALAQLLRWKGMAITTKQGRPFWIGVEDYVGSCSNHAAAREVFEASRSHDFSACVTDTSGGQKVVCYWSMP
jgi:cysteinyl-tRNA synthetase